MRLSYSSERANQILKLRRAGKSFVTIANQFGITPTRVQQIHATEVARERIRAIEWQTLREITKRDKTLHNLQVCCDVLYGHAVSSMGAILKDEYTKNSLSNGQT